MSNRYKVVKGSQSYHYYFEYTVLDTEQPQIIGGEHYRNQYEAVCECFDQVDADKICAALNAWKDGSQQL